MASHTAYTSDVNTLSSTHAPILLATLALLISIAVPARAAAPAADEAWLKKNAACWKRLPARQRPRLESVLRNWPAALRGKAASQNPAFPCNIVLAVDLANKAVHKHIQENPLDISYEYDIRDRKAWPGFQADRQLATIAIGSKETLAAGASTRRRDCIGMQEVVINALNRTGKGLIIEAAALVIGNESLGRFPAKALDYATGKSPAEAGIHHVAAIWPRLQGDDVAGSVPEYAVILDYWPWQDASEPHNIKTKTEFAAEWDALNRAGELRRE